MALSKRERRQRIKKRIRKKIKGTSESPRLTVFRSNKHIYAQLIDDVNGLTILSASSKDKVIVEKSGLNKTQIAEMVGALVSERAKEKGVEQLVFDRNGYLYHGRVKALAESVRKGGLKF